MAKDPVAKERGSDTSTDGVPPGGPSDDAVPGEPGDSDGLRSRTDQWVEIPSRVTNVFYGMVNAKNGTFGATGVQGAPGTSRPSVTGPLNDHEVEEAVRGFVRPEGFVDAAELLTDRYVLVLAGEAGAGKRTSAISLLSETVGSGIAVLPPSQTLESLAGRKFVSGHGYIVLDWFGVDRRDSPAEHEYQWSVLLRRVGEAGARLILTCDRNVPVGATAPVSPWARPGTAAILRGRLAKRFPGNTLDEDASRAAEEAAAALPDDCPVADVVAVAERLAAGEFPETAVEQVLRSSSHTRVRGWFDGHPNHRDIADATALALLHGLHERDYEILSERLHQRMHWAFPPPVDLRDKTARTTGCDFETPADRLPARRGRRGTGGHPLIRVDRRDDGWMVRRFPEFVEEGDRDEVLRQLWERYDADFWNAVEVWARTVVGHAAWRVHLARGLAALAGNAFEEVHDLYLDRWSRGSGGNGRETCVFVLWSMCMDEGLAPTVLRTVDRWLSYGTSAQAETALYVWSGELGVSYPTEAANRLWDRIFDEEGEHRFHAALSVGTLFGSLLDRGGNGRALLRRLSDDLAHLGRFGPGRINRTLLLTAVFSVLTVSTSEPFTPGRSAAHDTGRSGDERTDTSDSRHVRERTADEPGDRSGGGSEEGDQSGDQPFGADPAITRHLMLVPDQIPTVALLWTEAVRYRPVRRAAIDALWRTLLVLHRHGADAQERARELVLALVPLMRSDERPGFRSGFVSAARTHDDDPFTGAVLDILALALEEEGVTASGAVEQSTSGPLKKVTSP
ncbi:hypothetical protein HFP72_18160 [Nocardiopsis sp. ARC36]